MQCGQVKIHLDGCPPGEFKTNGGGDTLGARNTILCLFLSFVLLILIITIIITIITFGARNTKEIDL